MRGDPPNPVRRRRPRAGKQLRASLDAALAAASRQLAAQLEFSEQERLIHIRRQRKPLI
jgi:hypothetical protein